MIRLARVCSPPETDGIDRFVEEVQQEGSEHAVLEAGFFDGSPDRFAEVHAHVLTLAHKRGWY